MIFDARARPPGSPFDCLSSQAKTREVNMRFGVEPCPSFAAESVPDWLAEQSAAGVAVTAAIGRNTESCRVSNDELARIQAEAGGAVVSVAGIDVAGRCHDPLDEIDRCMSMGMGAIAIDPGTAVGQRPDISGVALDSPLVRQVAARCGELEIPTVILTGPFSARSLADARPERYEDLFESFRGTTFVASHGFYPFVTEAIACAWRHSNVVLCPDVYVMAPGGTAYLDAAQSMLVGQVAFGSAYPYASAADVLSKVRASGLHGAGLDSFLGGAATRAFGRALEHLA